MKSIKVVAAGSVDDGKSTLIGRLLYETKSIFDDQIQQIQRASQSLGRDELDLSLITDGLKAEREQGITIDVAYRYITTPKRTILIADTPGHVEYTRNMVTGASTADLGAILVDARFGMLPQTVRHLYILSLLDVQHIIFCINKMDMIKWSSYDYYEIVHQLRKVVNRLEIPDVYFIPMCAKSGDNVVHLSDKMKWYKGKTFLEILEEINVEKINNSTRFPVQSIIRKGQYRGCAGRLASGTFRPADKVVVLPSMVQTTIKTIDVYNDCLWEVKPGDSVSMTLFDDVSVNRGDLLVSPDDIPYQQNTFAIMMCWFNHNPLKIGRNYRLRNHMNETTCMITSVNYKVDVMSFEHEFTNSEVQMNDIVCAIVRTSKPIYTDPYKKNHITGSLIFIDEVTNETVAAGMIQ